MEHYETRKSREAIYDGKVFSVYLDQVELENGCMVSREVVEHHGGVAVIALDESDRLLLVRQYRYGSGRELLELPAGKLNPGENPRECGIRELAEETGYLAGHCELLVRIIPTPAYNSEEISIYTASDLSFVQQNPDPDEFLSVERLSLEQALELCMAGKISDSKTLAGILMYARLMGK